MPMLPRLTANVARVSETVREVDAALRAAGQGELLGSLRLNGEIDLPADREGRTRRCSTTLCRTRTGLWLVGLLREAEPVLIDLLALDHRLRYRAQVLGDRLEVDEWRLGVPRGQAEPAQQLIALARIDRAFGRHLAPARGSSEDQAPPDDDPFAWTSPLIEPLDPREQAWLHRWLDSDEHLLVWLHTDDLHRFPSSPAGDVQVPITLVMTDRRQGLVAIGPLGDLWSAPLPSEALEVIPQLGRDRVKIGEHDLRTTLTNEAGFALIAELSGLAGPARLEAFAHALWQIGSGARQAALIERAAAVLERLDVDRPLAKLALALIVRPELVPADERGNTRLPPSVFAALQRLIERDDLDQAGRALLDWWRQWKVGPVLGEVLVEHLCELGQAGLRVALPLHEQLRPALQAELDDDQDRALLDFVLVEHLLELHRPGRALELLEQRRAHLPGEELQDLLPPQLERAQQGIRVLLHELMVAAHAQLGVGGHVQALLELARLQPLVRERVAALVEALAHEAEQAEQAEQAESDPKAESDQLSLRYRAERVLELLREDAFEREPELGAELEARRPVHPLRERELELLRHPTARADGVLGRLQGTLAKVAVPDCSVLKSYCARANLAREQVLADTLADASVLLGLGAIEVFISRGDKSLGLRAYEGPTSFVLIGGDHFDPSSDAYLPAASLRFALTAELAHLRFGHSRVTSDEVWAGTLDLGLTGLSMLITAAPLLKGFKAPAKHLLDKLGAPAIDRWRKRLAASQGSRALGSENSELIAAHRVMQLTADRAGLLACGDPRAAIEAMFRVHPSHLSQRPVLVRRGLRETLTRPTRSDDERERLRLEDLAVRIAALLSFYLSDDYVRLV